MLHFGTVTVKLSKDCFQYDMVWYCNCPGSIG
jgi:hypothetical protein